MFDSTQQWWTALRLVGAANVLIWIALACWTGQQRADFTPQTWALRRLQLLLCAGYVFGCAWRSMLPMYWSRWLADEAHGRVYFDVLQGALDASTRWTVTHSWQIWQSEVTWMTLYFSIAVWISLALVPLPRLRPLSPAIASAR